MAIAAIAPATASNTHVGTAILHAVGARRYVGVATTTGAAPPRISRQRNSILDARVKVLVGQYPLALLNGSLDEEAEPGSLA